MATIARISPALRQGKGTPLFKGGCDLLSASANDRSPLERGGIPPVMMGGLIHTATRYGPNVISRGISSGNRASGGHVVFRMLRPISIPSYSFFWVVGRSSRHSSPPGNQRNVSPRQEHPLFKGGNKTVGCKRQRTGRPLPRGA